MNSCDEVHSGTGTNKPDDSKMQTLSQTKHESKRRSSSTVQCMTACDMDKTKNAFRTRAKNKHSETGSCDAITGRSTGLGCSAYINLNSKCDHPDLIVLTDSPSGRQCISLSKTETKFTKVTSHEADTKDSLEQKVFAVTESISSRTRQRSSSQKTGVGLVKPAINEVEMTTKSVPTIPAVHRQSEGSSVSPRRRRSKLSAMKGKLTTDSITVKKTSSEIHCEGQGTEGSEMGQEAMQIKDECSQGVCPGNIKTDSAVATEVGQEGVIASQAAGDLGLKETCSSKGEIQENSVQIEEVKAITVEVSA